MSNEGKKVKTHYRGTLEDGTQFDCSYDREPLAFTCCAGQMIPGFDAAVKDMVLGEKKTVKIPAADAYGEVNPDLVQTIAIAQLPGSENLPVNETVYLADAQGRPFPAKVVAKDDVNITFDMNHELAGKDLIFEIELVEIED